MMSMSSGKWRIWSVIAGACIAIGVTSAIYLLFAIREGSASGLTMEEARREVLKQYGGEILESRVHNDGYLLRLKTVQGMYEVTVGGERGNVDGIRLLERFDGDDGAGGEPDSSAASPTLPAASAVPPTLEPAPSATPGKGSPASPTAQPTPVASPSPAPPAPTVTIKPPTRDPGGKPSSTASVHITVEKAKSIALAKVEGKVTDVEKDDDNGVWYYYVDIDTNDGREAEVQLNAASGAVLSVTFDDDDDDDDDDD